MLPSSRRTALVGVALVLSSLATTVAAQGGRTPQSYRLAIGLIQRGLHDDAAKQLERFLNESPRHGKATEAWYRLGSCRVETGDPKAAVQAFRRALADEEFPLRAECHYRLGTCLQDLRRHADAAKQFDELPREHGADHYLAAAAYYGAGECLRDAGDDRGALPRFQAAAKAASDEEFGFSGLYQAGFAQLRLADDAAAQKTFAELARRFPDHEAIAEIKFREGEAAYRGGRYADAEKAYRAASRAGGPFADDALHGLAWCRLKDEAPDEALELFRDILERFEDSELAPHAQLGVGRLLLRGGENEAAERELSSLLARKDLPDDIRAPAFELRGLARLATGEADSAQKDFEQAMGTADAAVGGARLHYNLGDSFAKRGSWADALSRYERAADTDDDELKGEARYAQVLALHKLGKYEESATRAASFVAEQPRHRLVPLAKFAIAENLFSAQEYAASLRMYDSLRKDHPKADVVAFKGAYATYLAGDARAGAQRFDALIDDAALSDAHREEALSMVALTRFEAGQMDPALAAADRYAARYKDGKFIARTETIAGRVLRQKGELEAAQRRMARAAKAEQAPERAAQLTLERADVLFERGDFNAARDAYAGLKGGPDTIVARALEGLAWCAFELGDDDACRAQVGAALAHPQVGDAAPGLIELFVNLNHRAERWNDAAVGAERFLDQYPKHPRAPELRYALGVAQSRGGQHEIAMNTLAALARDGGTARPDLVYYELAWAARKAGKEGRALSAFAKVTETTADVELAGESNLHRGEHALEEERYAEARGYFAKIEGQLEARARYRIGHAWLEQENLEAAAQAFEEVATIGSDDSLHDESLFMAGETRLRLGDPKRAAVSLSRMLKRAPDHERAQRARLFLGECAVRNGNPADAIGQLQQYLQRGAEEDRVAKSRAHLWLGRARQDRKEHAAAEKSFAEVTAMSEGELGAEAQFRIGECRRAREDLAGAADAFVQLSILYSQEPWVSRGLLQTGICYDELGQKAKAQKFYGEVMERFPDSDSAKLARQRKRGD